MWIFIGVLIGFLLARPTKANAPTPMIQPDEVIDLIQNDVIVKPIIPTSEEEVAEVKKYEQSRKKKSVAAYPCAYPTQCVCYAKQITGVYGSWGDGGRNLSANSGPVVGAVIIFRNVHVGVITIGIDSPEFKGLIGYTDRNGMNDRKIRELVWTTINDPMIWKYHKF